MKRSNRLGTSIATALASMAIASTASADIFVRADNLVGDTTGPTSISGKWFVADSFSFGVEREMKESGEKGGTEDINIGIGELQECTISKSMDSTSAALAQAAINGRTLGSCEVCFSETQAADSRPICYLKYKLDRCYVRSWSISGDADDRPTEEVAFYFNKIAFGFATTKDGREVHADSGSWDQERNRPWPEGEEGILDDLEPPPPESP
ncbi:MAG: type VI secretion system tube protein Hcp [Xanthomonadales bacterium]|nr:type VI secretion system tube protein Hcp [Xanthomonadales bacterium]